VVRGPWQGQRMTGPRNADLPGPVWLLGDSEPLLRAEEKSSSARRSKLACMPSICCAAVPDRAELKILVREGEAAFQRFVLANVRLAAWLARRRVAVGATGGLSVEDLIAEGVQGVIRAVQKWDYTLGVKFSTDAYDWVRNVQQSAIASQSPATLDEHDRARCVELISERAELTAQLGRTPTHAELASALGVTQRAVCQVLEMLALAQSLEEPTTADGDQLLVDTLAAPDPLAIGTFRATRTVAALMAHLTARERSLLAELFGLDTRVARPLAIVAGARGVAPEKVSAFVTVALTKMRAAARQELAA
jgi:DNA-directed RNA polymerase sigma subunit (sigma70/sigma32)